MPAFNYIIILMTLIYVTILIIFSCYFQNRPAGDQRGPCAGTVLVTPVLCLCRL